MGATGEINVCRPMGAIGWINACMTPMRDRPDQRP